MLFLLILVILVLAYFLLYKQENAGVRPVMQKTADRIITLGSDFSTASRSWIERLPFGRQPQKMAEKFCQWSLVSPLYSGSTLPAGLKDDLQAFHTWLGGLSPKESQAYAQLAANFCHNLGFDIEWLVDEQKNPTPILKKELSDALMLYNLALSKAARVQKDIALHHELSDWAQYPERKKETNLRLFARLLEMRLVSFPPGLYTANDKKRDQYISQNLMDFYKKNPNTFSSLFIDALTSRSPLPELPPSSPPQVQPKPEKRKVETSPRPRLQKAEMLPAVDAKENLSPPEKSEPQKPRIAEEVAQAEVRVNHRRGNVTI